MEIKNILSSTPGKLGTAAISSVVVILPFVILELINNPGSPAVPLFVAMWILTFSLVLLLLLIVQSLRSRHRANLFTLLSKLVLLTVIASIWVVLIVDQMPCFLGVPNCD